MRIGQPLWDRPSMRTLTPWGADRLPTDRPLTSSEAIYPHGHDAHLYKVAQHGDDLDGLPQPHVVGQDAVDPVGVEADQPPQALHGTAEPSGGWKCGP